MVNIFRLSRYTIAIIMIIATVWLVIKKNEAMKRQKAGDEQNFEVSGFDKIMFGLTGILEGLHPTSSFTRQMTKQKNTIINHL